MVYHVLADGTITKDITGRVVKISDANESLYRLMSTIGTRKDKRVHKEEKKYVG